MGMAGAGTGEAAAGEGWKDQAGLLLAGSGRHVGRDAGGRWSAV